MSSILYSIRPDDGRPVYRQIVDQIKGALGSGKLRPGDQLPTHRDLARELVIAPLTVKKAYDTLQAEGLIVMVQGKGTFVTKRGPAAASKAHDDLDSRAEMLVHQARLLNLSPEELQRLIGRHWKK
ncbi:MAG TPA: GntR family transcriptional regulator [Planctomycetota bacterium]|nr:GntR family transcriptional regulator [Planctomycetota bacterium]